MNILRNKRILLIAMSDSIHTARWISQIADQGWDIHLFPSIDCGLVHSDIKNVTVYHSLYGRPEGSDRSVHHRGVPVYSKKGAFGCIRIAKALWPSYRIHQLKRMIDQIKPDIVHSMEIQAAGYLTMEAKRSFSDKFPPWIVTNWGSDISLFGRLPEHERKIREVLNSCDYYTCECQRDVSLAKKFGFKGRILPVFPNTGGFDLDLVARLRGERLPSERKIIMLKGYQHWAGRALVGLRALKLCSSMLNGYEIVIHTPSPETMKAAKRFSKSTGIRTVIIPKETPHQEMLRFHGQARTSVGLSISDGISTSFLEALVMGSFPIQSWTACADEWIDEGNTGFLVPPEDPEAVAKAIRRALTDDELVNKAAEINWKTTVSRLDQTILKPKTVEIYSTIAKQQGINQ